MDVAVVDKLAQQLVLQMQNAGEAVSLVVLQSRILSQFGVGTFEELGFKRAQCVPTLGKVRHIENKVNAFVGAYVAVRTLSTLHQLEQDLCEEFGVQHFVDLALGPLLCNTQVSHLGACMPHLGACEPPVCRPHVLQAESNVEAWLSSQNHG